MSAFQNLEELFVKYQRLNQILKDNWNDSTQDTFDSNYLIPIATEWSQYHSAVTDMKSRVKSTRREIDEDIEQLERDIQELSGPCESSLQGCCVYGFNCMKGKTSVERHFIVEQRDLNFLDDDQLWSLAMSKFPTADEVENIHLIESISIH